MPSPSMKTICIDDQVYDRIKNEAQAFETINSVIRRMLALPPAGIKRGRPKKSGNGEVSPTRVVFPKGKRGRPKKNVNGDVPVVLAKRKRGRPKKDQTYLEKLREKYEV